MLEWIADALPHADYLLPNDEQVLGFTGEASWPGRAGAVEPRRRLRRRHPGPRGALVVTADDVIEVPAYAVDVVDTTGCGDAFSAGFLRGSPRSRPGARPSSAARPPPRSPGAGTDAGEYSLESE